MPWKYINNNIVRLIKNAYLKKQKYILLLITCYYKKKLLQ